MSMTPCTKTPIPAEWCGIPTDCESWVYQQYRADEILNAYDRAGLPTPYVLDGAVARESFSEGGSVYRWEVISTLEENAAREGVVSWERLKEIHDDYTARAHAAERAYRAQLFGRDFHQLPREDALMMPCTQCGAGSGEECRSHDNAA